MKKRKELDALVSGGKSGKRTNGKKPGTGGGSYSAHELLSSSRLESDSSDLDDFAAVLQPRRSRKKAGSHTHLAAMCLPLCQFVLVTTCILVSATLIWLHIGMREDLDILRAHIQKVEAGNRNTPEALHLIHSKLKDLDFNVSTIFLEISKNVVDLVNCTTEIKQLKETTTKLQDSIAAAPEIQDLPKGLNALSESVAGFGSKINALESAVKELKDSQSTFQNTAHNLDAELDSVKSAVQELSNASKLNSTELLKSQSSPLVRDLTFQSAIQETNQLVSYLQKELLNLVRSVDKMNSSLTALNDLSTRVDNVNEAIISIVNDTHSHTAKTYALENYVNTNLTLRVEHLENEGAIAIEKSRPSTIQTSQLQELINQTVTRTILSIINPNVSPIVFSKTSGNYSDEIISRTHDVLLLLSALLKQVNHIPITSLLNEDNATEIITYLLNNTLHELTSEYDFKIQDIEAKINKSITDHQHLITDQGNNKRTSIESSDSPTHDSTTSQHPLTTLKSILMP